MRTVTEWRVCMDFRVECLDKEGPLSDAFMDSMFDGLEGMFQYYFLVGYSFYNQISSAPEYDNKTILSCPDGTFACKHMPFVLCNVLETFQHCLMYFFSDMNEDSIEMFMDYLSLVGDSFDSPLDNYVKVIKIFADGNMVLNVKKLHFILK